MLSHLSQRYWFEGDCVYCDLDLDHCDLSLDGCGGWHPHKVKLSEIRKALKAQYTT